MKQLWAPWRIEYILSKKTQGCVFCNKPKENKDEQNYIVYRGKKNFIILNNYPYNSGHLMVSPYRHVANLEDLTKEESSEHSDLVTKSVKVLKKVFKPDGFNIGMNLGESAGAGIKDHLHTHIVPRWKEDTNFMPVIADTKVIPQALSSTYRKLKGMFV